MNNLLIVIDKKDRILGCKTKNFCHQGEGLLHRAFSIFIFNGKGELLLQKRNRKKLLWPLFWSNSCCSHARKGEVTQESAQKRLQEELGFSCPLTLQNKLLYKACYQNIGSENEITYIFTGQYEGEIRQNKKEVAEIKWMTLAKLKEELKTKPEKYTPWLKLIMENTVFKT